MTKNKKKSDPFAALLASIPGGGGGNKGGNKKGGGSGGGNKGGGSGGAKPSSSTTIKGVNVGAKLGPGEIKDIVAASSLTPQQVINRATNKDIPLSSAAQAYSSSLTPTVDPAKVTTLAEIEAANRLAGGPSDGAIDIGPGEYNAATTGYEWDTRKAIAQLQEAGATERLKYEVDNRIPLTEAEYKGKIDLQKIVNAGNRRVANIQRGSQMFASMMGAFNF